MAATAVIAAVGLALAIGMAAKGLSDQDKARKMRATNIRPTYKINEEEQTNQQIAASMSGQGLTANAKQYYNQNSERFLTSSIDAILKGGGNENLVGQIYGMSVDSAGRLALADDEKRLNNLKMYMEQNRRMSGERDKEFQVNEYAPYADTAKAASELNAQGAQWISQGISTGYGAVSGFAGGMQRSSDTRKMQGYGSTGNNVGNAPMVSYPDVDRPDYPASSYANTAYEFNKLSPEQQATYGSLYWRGY